MVAGVWVSRRGLNPARYAAFVYSVFLSCSVTTVDAHLPEYLGRKYILVDENRPEPPEPCGGDRSAMRERAQGLEVRLAEQRLDQGVYSAALADPSGELGKLYGDLCNHPAALDNYRQALQLIRISDGLLSRAQLPYLRAMAKSSRAIGDYESAQRTMRYVFRVHELGRGKLDEEALADSLAYFRLAREIFIDPRSRGDVGLFFEAYQDNRAMLDAQRDAAGGSEGVPYALLKAIAISQLRNMYLLLGTDLTLERQSGNDGAALDFFQRNQMLSLGQGRTIIEELIAHPGAQSAQEQGQLHLRLGNWQQWNNKWQSACDSYALAWRGAEEAGDAELLKRLASPAELPEDARLWDSLYDPGISVKATIEAEFHVSPRGYVSRVDARVDGEESSVFAGRVGRWLRDSHVRPAVSEDGCVEGDLAGRVYRLLD